MVKKGAVQEGNGSRWQVTDEYKSIILPVTDFNSTNCRRIQQILKFILLTYSLSPNKRNTPDKQAGPGAGLPVIFLVLSGFEPVFEGIVNRLAIPLRFDIRDGQNGFKQAILGIVFLQRAVVRGIGKSDHGINRHEV